MGSLEEEKLLQMVHDFIESESTPSSSSLPPNYYNSSSSLNHAQFRHSTRYFSLQEILKKKTEEERMIQEKVNKLMKNKLDLEKTRSLKQWLVKCLLLDGLHASLCQTSWVTTPSCPCGSYEYIEIIMKDAKGGSIRLIVDIDFKSQFEVARPTQSYKELSSKLPTIFLGREKKLNSIISLLCSAAEESLKERGLHVPPWRRATYMQSKWKLSNSTSNNKGNMCSSDNTCMANHNNNNNKMLVLMYPID